MNETQARAVVAGKKAGEDFSAAAWMVGGVFLGLIMPLISHAMRKPEPPAPLLVSMSGGDRLLFADAYGDAAKSKRNRFSWIGTGISFLLFFTLTNCGVCLAAMGSA